MSYDDDAAKLAALGKALPSLDLDATTAARIAHTARQRVGRGPSPLRLVEPALAAALAISYLVWAIARVLEASS
jgi:hypothetical protein